ncbi:MAG: YdcF family protein [Methylobacteriaceae bacterium]|jgi:uncharacterized SAM-binding protein YcdF (DUF218 family)|nr:YdcF family protein [Methylobacteriaceae bacterium]
MVSTTEHYNLESVLSRRGETISRGIRAVVRGVLCALLAGFCVGFLSFSHIVNSLAPADEREVEGIVVLTGGADRIAEAFGLLSSGSGRRLLISGVYAGTDMAELRRRFPAYKDRISCCVDLDYQAANTAGNARETMEWVRKNGFSSLIVVTSNYHMPRALTEIRHTLTNVRIIPYPVASPNVDTRHWWSSLRVFRLMGTEYLKYLYAKARASRAVA